jgi:phosphoglucosamine mutase
MDAPMHCRPSADLGRARRIDVAAGRYIEFCISTVPSNLDLRGLKIVVDCANGAAYHVAPHVFHELGAEVSTIGVKPDGFNINDRVGATSPQALQSEVKRVKADLGIALDGDADRLLMVDGDGSLFDGDQLLYAVAKHRAAARRLKGVVGTLMSNLALEQAVQKLGVGFVRAKVGDRYVLEMLQEKGWELGGENSGHMICLDKHTTGDGIVAALQVLTALRESKSPLGKLAGELKLFPQLLINVKLKGKFDWQSDPAIKKAELAAEKALGVSGRVLLRPSGTEPLLRVMVEGRDKAKVKRIADSLASVVAQAANR